MTRELFVALQDAAAICRAASANPRKRRLLAEIDLLRAAVAISAIEPAADDELASLAQLVFGVRDEALELERDIRLAREVTASMMD